MATLKRHQKNQIIKNQIIKKVLQKRSLNIIIKIERPIQIVKNRNRIIKSQIVTVEVENDRKSLFQVL